MTPDDLKYTDTHEWLKQEPDGTFTVGITFHAQDMLGDVVFVQNPAPGRRVKKGEEIGVIESVKAAADIYAPLSGEHLVRRCAREDQRGPVYRVDVPHQARRRRGGRGVARRGGLREGGRGG